MSGPLDLARALAGPDASDEAVVRQLYAVRKREHEWWYGTSRPFPEFEDWLLRQPTEKD